MQPVSLALFWHQHQPYYPDDITGETLMPWVRLHATKDYIGMALHIEEVPEFRCSMNLVPSLLVQIERYVNGGSDLHLEKSHLPADSLTQDDAYYILDHFFMANEWSMIRPYPRYSELHQKRGLGRDTAEQALSRFTTQDLRDLQVWNNLTWIHDLVFERDSALREFRNKGKGYTESEKVWLLKKQIEIVSEVIPLHKKLADGGQLELTTTPFYHPILPLLWDKKSAREAMPGCPLPKYTQSYREDAVRHLQRAVEYHTKLFGTPPKGMWPSEGSVSQEILGAIADVGIDWIATDEEILMHSTDGFIHRDGNGLVNRPEMLYRPWRVEQDGKSLQMVFRDHGLSDLIGFHYQRNDPNWAATDLLGKVKEIGRSIAHQTDSPALVPIILDGENCWEYYPDGGVAFLRNLYRSAVQDKDVTPVRISDYLQQNPATHRISRLFAGSWINHDFYIWIGHQDDRDAWDLLHTTREFLLQAEKSGKFSPEQIRRAWDELMIAEGSDWFWWYGDDHSSAQDWLFDDLFRRHLRNVYQLLGAQPPGTLHKAVSTIEQRQIHTNPRAFCNVHVDGRASYFEWLNAGHYQSGSERGTMTMVSESVIKDVYFGFDIDRFLLRADTATKTKHDLRSYDEIRLRFIDPYGLEIRAPLQNDGKQTTYTPEVIQDEKSQPESAGLFASNFVFELSVPWKELQVTVGQQLHLALELIKGNEVIERVPSEGTIALTVPSSDFEMQIWQA